MNTSQRSAMQRYAEQGFGEGEGIRWARRDIATSVMEFV